eukprot:UN24702
MNFRPQANRHQRLKLMNYQTWILMIYRAMTKNLKANQVSQKQCLWHLNRRTFELPLLNQKNQKRPQKEKKSSNDSLRSHFNKTELPDFLRPVSVPKSKLNPKRNKD